MIKRLMGCISYVEIKYAILVGYSTVICDNWVITILIYMTIVFDKYPHVVVTVIQMVKTSQK